MRDLLTRNLKASFSAARCSFVIAYAGVSHQMSSLHLNLHTHLYFFSGPVWAIHILRNRLPVEPTRIFEFLAQDRRIRTQDVQDSQTSTNNVFSVKILMMNGGEHSIPLTDFGHCEELMSAAHV
jgi:hypothetical protein